MFQLGNDHEFERPANIQVNLDQQIRLGEITFSIKSGFFNDLLN
jgi:hypothetical protein